MRIGTEQHLDRATYGDLPPTQAQLMVHRQDYLQVSGIPAVIMLSTRQPELAGVPAGTGATAFAFGPGRESESVAKRAGATRPGARAYTTISEDLRWPGA